MIHRHASQRGSARSRLIIVGFVLLALGGGVVLAYGVYAFQQTRISDLQSRLDQTMLDLEAVNRQLSDQPQDDARSVSYSSLKGVEVVLYSPRDGGIQVSPLAIVGEIPGNWSFEASFPVVLKDASGAIIAQDTAQVLGDWMTTDPVLFSLKLPFTTTVGGMGTLLLQKDNPSGLPENDDSIAIPVML